MFYREFLYIFIVQILIFCQILQHLFNVTSKSLQCHFKVNFKATSIKFHFTLKYSSILPIA